MDMDNIGDFLGGIFGQQGFQPSPEQILREERKEKWINERADKYFNSNEFIANCNVAMEVFARYADSEWDRRDAAFVKFVSLLAAFGPEFENLNVALREEGPPEHDKLACYEDFVYHSSKLVELSLEARLEQDNHETRTPDQVYEQLEKEFDEMDPPAESSVRLY